MDIQAVKKQWQELGATIEEVDYKVSGYHYNLGLERDQIRDLAAEMLKHGFYLVDLMAVHVTPAIEVVYQFAHYETLCRVLARAFVNDECELPTIADIYQGANWHERETHDLHGVVFTDHPYLETFILAEEDADLKPLLKKESMLKAVDAIRRSDEEEPPPKPKPAAKSAAKPEAKPAAGKKPDRSAEQTGASPKSKSSSAAAASEEQAGN